MIALEGIALAPGTAAGTAMMVRATVAAAARHNRAPADRDDLAQARRGAEVELRRRLETLPDGAARQILRAHLALLTDPMLSAAIEQHLDRGFDADAAVEHAGMALAARFERLDDPALRARAGDLRDVCECIARHLSGDRLPSVPTEARIVCAVELSAAQVLHLAEGRPLAFVLEGGTETSHATILMRALGVPAVIAVPGATTLVRDGDRVLVDGNRGQVIVNPDPDETAAVHTSLSAAPPACDAQPATTLDGVTIGVTATIAGVADAHRAVAAGADGVGLFRTEWLFLRNAGLPAEEDQYEIYRTVAGILDGRPVTVRAIDLGGDKQPPTLRRPVESNPALGLRGMRLAFAYPDLFQTQVRALVRAFAGRGFRLLLPMITDPADVARARDLLDRAADGGAASRFEIGVMIETPAAALMADELAAAADFLSLGTNDLTQYVLAADRDNADVAALYQPLHPAVLRLLRHTAAAAARLGKPLSVCGEIAGDPLVAPLLVGFGVTELSVAPGAVAAIKQIVRRISTETTRALGEELVALPTAAAVLARLARLPQADAETRCIRDA